MANEEEDQGRQGPPLYRGGKNVAQPPKKPLQPAPEGGPKGIHSEEEDEEEKPKRMKDIYKKTRLAGDVVSMEEGKKKIEDAKKAATAKTLKRVLEIEPKPK
jgi:hypothetical protein